MLPSVTIAGARVKPDMRIVHPDHGDITEDVARELARVEQEDNEEIFRTAAARQAILAKENERGGRVTPGFALKANIDHRIYDYWRKREGKGFWKSELDNMLKRHPEFRVRCRPDNPTVLLDGLKGTALARPATPSSRGGRWAA
jgi:hypothetical protein